MIYQNRCIAIVPAAGSGTRFGGDKSKLLFSINDEVILRRTIRILHSCSFIDHIIVPCRDENQVEFASLTQDFCNRISFCRGGTTRQMSVKNAIEVISEKWKSELRNLFVLIHDAARCLISVDLIKKVWEAALTFDAVTLGIPINDSIKRVRTEDRKINESVDRSGLWATQTPQIFRFKLLESAHLQNKFKNVTDDASLVQEIHGVWMVPGDRRNIKITTKEDLELAKAIVKST